MNSVILEKSIMLEDFPVIEVSKIFEGFLAPVTATVASRLIEKGYGISYPVEMDEFGIPNENSEITRDTVSAIMDDNNAALCNDVFGKYRQLAAENRCCYIHPTYGTVSRFGLVPLVSSMDQVGVLCKNARDGFALLSHIAGNDEKDGAMFLEESYNYTASEQDITIAIPDGMQMPEGKFNTVPITLEYFNVYKQVMYTLSYAELSHNINRYDGIKFGYRAEEYRNVEELYVNTRTESLGLPVKLAAIMGAAVLANDKYTSVYEKAMKIRRLIKQSLLFDLYDIIALPSDTHELTVLAGLPSVSFHYKGQDIQLVANVKNENILLKAWEVCHEV